MKPILYNNTDASDATKPRLIKYVWQGNQQFKNICTVWDNVTGEIVYQQQCVTMRLEHEIPANVLANGKSYSVKIKTIDVEDNASEESDAVVFYCLDAPSFKFTNANSIIRNSAYSFNVEYGQKQNEPIQSWSIDLYDKSKSKIASSGVMYTNEVNYTMTNLEDNSNYFIKAVCITLHGMECDTGYIPFSVEYVKPAVYSVLSLENIEKDGFIKIQSNIKSIECKSTKSVEYVDNEYVNLKNNSVYIDDDFTLDDNYVIKLSGYGFQSNSLLMRLSDGERSISLNYRRGCYDINRNIDMIYLELYVPVGITYMLTYSNYIPIPKETDILDIDVKYNNGLYSVYLKNREDTI